VKLGMEIYFDGRKVLSWVSPDIPTHGVRVALNKFWVHL